jgi:signal transduction histidine kinase
MQNDNPQSDLTFRVSSGLKDIIGRDLIFDTNIAVFELVKNSFDARAGKVDIIFDTNKIIIKDNGKGMTYDDLSKKWLFVAYSAKKQGIEDDDGNSKENYRNKIRPKKFYAGAKGIGRFSCDRLGSKLKLITKSDKPHSEIEQIEVNWEDFQNNPNEDFIKIPVKHSSRNNTNFNNFDNGTILEITDLRSIWNHKDILKLKHSLEKLINPFGSNSDDINAFEINIIADYLKVQDAKELKRYIKENPKDKDGRYCQTVVNGKIQNFIFETLNVKTTQIYTKFEEDGKYIITELIDRGVLIFKIREKNPYEHLKNIHFRLFFLNTVAKKNFGLKMKMKVVNFGSIFLFKNGFRVLPYGEPEDDSFGIDRRKSQGYSRFLGTRELLGKIDIIGNNNEFRETSSRSGGLIQTNGFNELVISFMEHCLKRLEKYVVDVQWAKATYRGLDRESSDISALNNVEAKALMINVISKIIKGKDVELLDYDKEFLNVLGEKLQDIVPDVFSDLERIAKKTNDESFLNEIHKVEERYVKLKRELEEEKKARIEAEERAIREAGAKKIAEERATIEKERARIAEYKRLDEGIKRKKAEEAERKAKLLKLEAEEAKQKAELEKLDEENARKTAENQALEQKTMRLKQDKYYQSMIALDLDSIINLMHEIGLITNAVINNLDKVYKSFDKEFIGNSELKRLEPVNYHLQRILQFTKNATKAGFNLDTEPSKIDIISFIKEYVENVGKTYVDANFLINFHNFENVSFEKEIIPIDLNIIVDNVITNSRRANAQKLDIIIKYVDSKKLILEFKDYGNGVDQSIMDINEIFDKGFSKTKRGAGLGLYHIKKIITSLGGEVTAQSIQKKGFSLIITLYK